MGRIPTESELRELYIEKKQSLSEIAIRLNFSVHKVTYWMSAYKIPRRSQSDAVYIKANPGGEPFKIKTCLTVEDERLKSLALGLYWGEGTKTNLQAIRIANSDFGVIRNFLRYLVRVCQVKEEKVHYYLQVFKDNDVKLAKAYWASQLSIDQSRINTGKPIPSMGKGTYKKFSRYGVMTLAFFNTHLKSYLMNELRKLGME